MNRRILTACLALSYLSACTERPAPAPSTQVSLASPKPLSDPMSASQSSDMPAPDIEEPEELPDLLGLSHEDQGSVRHLDRLNELEAQNDVEAALIEGRKALFDDPSDEAALLETAQLAHRANEKHLAILAYERLGELSATDAAPLIQHARILLELEDYDGAVRVSTQAQERDEGNPEIHLVLGRAQLSAGRLNQAIQAFETTLELSPDHPYALNNLGFALLRANRNPEAVTILERAVELLPNVAFVNNNLGVAYERVGRHAEARLAYEDAVAASPKYVKAKLNAKRMDQELARVQVEGYELSTDSEPIETDTASETGTPAAEDFE